MATRFEASAVHLVFEAVAAHGAIPPSVRCAGLIVSGGYLYLFGGSSDSDEGQNGNDLFVLDFCTMSWEQRAMRGDGPACCAIACTMYRQGSVFGLTYDQDPDQLLQCATEPNSCWERKTVPTGISYKALYWGDSAATIYMAMGIGKDGDHINGSNINYVEVTGTPPNTFFWRPFGETPVGRHHPAGCMVGHLLYMFGGANEDGKLADLYSYDGKRRAWVCIYPANEEDVGPLPRCGVGMVHRDNVLYVFGGLAEDKETLGDVWAFCLVERIWHPVGMLPKPLRCINTLLVGEDIYILGKDDGKEQEFDTFYRLHFPAEPTKAAEALQKDLATIMHDPALCDVTFCVEGVNIPSSRAILAARSPVMRAMLLGNFQEAQTGPPTEIQDLKHKIFTAMLQYLITATVPGDMLVEDDLLLYAAADRFDIPDLRTLCLSNIRQGVGKDNVVKIACWAVESKSAVTKEACQAFLHANSKDMLSRKDVHGLPSDIWVGWTGRLAFSC